MVGGWGWGPDWAGWLVMGVSMLLFWGLVVAGIIALVRVINRPSAPPPSEGPGGASASASARRILDERYARGEIDEQEYRRRRDLLQGGG